MEKHKILFVDDEEALCRSVKLNLEQTGKYDVHTETKGMACLAAAKKFKPDLIILDFRMPDLHGADAALQLQNDKITKDIPIIFLTGVATKDDLAAQGDKDLCEFVITKPATTDDIIKSIESHLGRRTNLGFLDKLFNQKKEVKFRQ